MRLASNYFPGICLLRIDTALTEAYGLSVSEQTSGPFIDATSLRAEGAWGVF